MLRRLAGPGLLVAVLMLVYSPAFDGRFIWDDDVHVTGNMALRSLQGLGGIWLRPGLVPAREGSIPTQYYPLLQTSLWIEYRLWGLDPRGYHVTNVVLHAVVSLLAWAVLRRLQVPGAPLAAAVFALHPVQVESVAWITELKNLLSGGFYLSAALAYFRFSPPDGAPASGRPRHYVLALALFVCALLSKTVTLSLPVALGLVLWWKRGRLARRELASLLAMAAVGMALALVTIAIEWHVAGASGRDFRFTLLERWLIAGRALWFYLGKLLWPAGQAFVYPYWEIDAGAAWQYVFPLAALLATAAAWLLRGTWGRAPLAASLFFVATLLPALGFVDFFTMRYTFVADHFQYLASLGPIALAASGASALFRRRGWGRPGLALALALLCALGTLSFRRAHVFRSNETLWQDTLAKNPRCWMALNNLGADRLAENRLDEARVLLERAISVRPDHSNARMNLGVVLQRQGHVEQAIEQFNAAAQDRRHRSAHFRIGQLRAEQGRYAEAVAHYRQALAADPGRAQLLNALATALARDDRLGEAVADYRLALAADPDLLDARYNLALLLAQRGEADEAREQFALARKRATAAGSPEVVRAIDEHVRGLGPRPAPAVSGR